MKNHSNCKLKVQP